MLANAALLWMKLLASTHHARPLLDERIQIVPYDPGWPTQAEEEIDRLRVALGRGFERSSISAVGGPRHGGEADSAG